MCEKLFGTDGGRMLRIIQAEARKYGVEISKRSAAVFRDNVLDPYIESIKAKNERAQQVAHFAQEGLSLSDAAAVRLSETVFDELMSPTAEKLTAEERDTYSKIIARARSGDQRAKKLEADLRVAQERIGKYEREKTEWQEAREKARAALEAATAPAARKGISRETLKRAQEALKLL